jgi:hypothetical protein
MTRIGIKVIILKANRQLMIGHQCLLLRQYYVFIYLQYHNIPFTVYMQNYFISIINFYCIWFLLSKKKVTGINGLQTTGSVHLKKML